MKLKHTIPFLSILVFWACQRSGAPSEATAEFHGRTMGTVYTIKAVLPPSLDRELARQRIEQTLKRVNELMSTYDPESELSRFNRSEAGVWFPVAPETMQVLTAAVQVGNMSGGALDITVGPLVNLWGFGPKQRSVQTPSEQALAEARNLVGLDKLRLQTAPAAVWKEKRDMYCDLSAVAKGFGVDLVASALVDMGVGSCMVEIGGEVRSVGRKPDGQAWRIGVAVPDGSQRVSRVLEITDMAVATSGDYQNYYEIDGKRFSHTIDPQTGRPIDHHLASVTVVHDNCLMADAWATALDVLGPEKGMALAEERKLAALFIVREAQGFIERRSSAMSAFVRE